MYVCGSGTLRVVCVLLIVVVKVLIFLQGSHYGLVQKEIAKGESSLDGIGLFTYCVEDTYGTVISNRDTDFLMLFQHETCVSFDEHLVDENEQPVIKEGRNLVIARWILIGLKFVSVSLLLIHKLMAMSSPSIRLLNVSMLLLFLGLLMQFAVMALMIELYYSFHGLYMWRWPWLMSMVSVAVYLVIIILHLMLFCCSEEDKEIGYKKIEGTEKDKNGNWLRRLLLLLTVSMVVLQYQVHSDHGAVRKVAGSLADNNSSSNKEQYYGLWFFCLDSVSQIQMGQGPTLKSLYQPDLCISFNWTTNELVSWRMIIIARVSIIIAHYMSIVFLFLAVYCKYAKISIQTSLFYFRFVLGMLAAASLTLAAIIVTNSLHDRFKLSYGFICLWISAVISIILFYFVGLQTFCKPDLFDETDDC